MTEPTPDGTGNIESAGSDQVTGTPLTSEEDVANPANRPQDEFPAGSPPGRGGQRPEEFSPDDLE